MNIYKNDSSRNGSVLLSVLIITSLVFILVASIITRTNNALLITERHVARLKAKAAAESLIEYGAADLALRFSRQSSLPVDELHVGKNPLKIPAAAKAFFADSDVIYDSLKLQAGNIPTGEWKLIHTDNPMNEFDSFRGRSVYSREINVYSAASVNISGQSSVSVYARERFEVRDAPLFTNAIFYNGILEINPGLDMDIAGPVHSNKDMYLAARSGASLNFYDKVSTAGSILYDEIIPVHIGGDVNLPTSLNPLVLKPMNSKSGILDSNASSWSEQAPSRWNGYVEDSILGAVTQNVVAFDDYVPDDPYTSVNEKNNAGYAIIEPLLPSDHPDRKNPSIRAQKMAYQAGLLIKLEPNGQLKAYTPKRTNPNDPRSDPQQDIFGDIIYDVVDLPPDVIGDPDDTYTSIQKNEPEYYDYQPASTETQIQWVKQGKKWKEVTVQLQIPAEIRGGFYDHRENKGIDTVALDVQRLKEYIDSKNNSSTGFNGTYDVDKNWNGVVYVEFPTSNDLSTIDNTQYAHGTSSGQNSYNIVPAVDPNIYTERALVIMDAKEIPEPPNTAVEGFSIATNAPAYVIGSFNADGIPHSQDSTTPDDNSEKPAAIFADALTLLSDNWDQNRKFSMEDGRNTIENKRPASSYLEVAAAIVTGTPNTIVDDVPFPTTDPNRPLSLGVVNLPRFLEYWGSARQVTIRGSLVSLFESEVRPDGAPTNFNNHYVPPKRDWGYNTLFQNGQFPPGNPVVRNYRRLNFEEITQAEYNAELAAIN